MSEVTRRGQPASAADTSSELLTWASPSLVRDLITRYLWSLPSAGSVEDGDLRLTSVYAVLEERAETEGQQDPRWPTWPMISLVATLLQRTGAGEWASVQRDYPIGSLLCEPRRRGLWRLRVVRDPHAWMGLRGETKLLHRIWEWLRAEYGEEPAAPAKSRSDRKHDPSNESASKRGASRMEERPDWDRRVAATRLYYNLRYGPKRETRVGAAMKAGYDVKALEATLKRMKEKNIPIKEN